MIVSIRIDDDLYAKYAKRNPQDPRKALEEALNLWQDLEPGVPRLMVDGKELRELKRMSGAILSSPAELLDYVKRTTTVSIGGVGIELSVGARHRLEALAEAVREPYDSFTKRRLQNAVDQVVGF